jgi:hypothetical protein
LNKKLFLFCSLLFYGCLRIFKNIFYQRKLKTSSKIDRCST